MGLSILMRNGKRVCYARFAGMQLDATDWFAASLAA